MESFASPEDEVLFLFGQHAVEQAKKRGVDYYIRRLNPKEFRNATRGLRVRLGPERSRFVRSLPSDLQGALIHAMLDTARWDRQVLEAAAERIPDDESTARRPRKLRPVKQRKVTTTRLDQDQED